MTEISYQELVVTCEGCKKVRKFPVRDFSECEKLFKEFKCPSGCGRNMYSFFTVGRLKKKIKP